MLSYEVWTVEELLHLSPAAEIRLSPTGHIPVAVKIQPEPSPQVFQNLIDLQTTEDMLKVWIDDHDSSLAVLAG